MPRLGAQKKLSFFAAGCIQLCQWFGSSKIGALKQPDTTHIENPYSTGKFG